jgi:hypothetical protein
MSILRGPIVAALLRRLHWALQAAISKQANADQCPSTSFASLKQIDAGVLNVG